MEETYINLVKEFCENENKCQSESFLKKLFFLYPSKKISQETLHEIIEKSSLYFSVPYHDIKLIGSSHTGFSFIDKKKEGFINYYSKNISDVDIAIINEEYFLKVHKQILISSKDLMDLTEFKSANLSKYYIKNLIHGFIRPDSIGCNIEREKWQTFFLDLSNEYNLEISGALYLDEMCFLNRLKKQLDQFLSIEEVTKWN